MLSLIASLSCLLPGFAGQWTIKARFPGKMALTCGTTEQPPKTSRKIKASGTNP
jgi:hypothetical protein